jgi:probable F420-dependent oxidoreductase
MLVDTTVEGPLDRAAVDAAAAEAAGFRGVWTTEIAHDPFLPLALGAQATQSLDLGTGIAVAFARNPMSLAYTAWDLQALSGGRFFLGLGSQVKAHVERRFSMPFSQPAARMAELVRALRAIWASWQHGTALAFEGEFYRHTLMTPFFDPGPLECGAPHVLVAAVGEAMTRTAAQHADGMLVHAFTTERYLRDRTVPLLEQELSARGSSRSDFTLVLPALVATGADDAELERAVAETRRQIAFYASTPAYRATLELHGWGDLQPELQTLTKQGAWAQMAELVDDDVLHAYAVVGSPEQVGRELAARFDGLIDRLRPYLPYDHDPQLVGQVRSSLDAALHARELAAVSLP